MNITAFFKKDYIVGLDIGASSVKIAEFRKAEDGLHLAKADLREIKASGDEALCEKEILAALRDLFKGVDVKKSKIVVNINCLNTAVKIARTPYMPKAELRDSINLHAKSFFPFPVENSFLDYEILRDVVEKGVRKYEIIAAVSPKATVEKYLSLLGKAGIKPVSLVPCPYALGEIVAPNDSREGKTICFVDIGASNAELIISKGKEFLFSRKIPVTGAELTKAMTGVLVSDRGKTELSLDEAEKIKREVGIPSEGEAKIIDEKISTTQILSMIRTPLEQLVSEIDRCFDYYREESAGGAIDEVLLFGGGAALGGIIKFLSEGLGIEVKLGDPLAGLKIEPNAVKEQDKISYCLELAVGAALTEGKGINLLPPEMKEETKRIIKRGTVEVAGTALILVSLLLYIGMRIQLGNYDKRISVAKLELASLQPEYKKAEAHHAANMVLVDEPYWEDIFRELGNRIPSEIHFTDMYMKDGVITMKGIVSSKDGEDILSDFIINLEKGIFKNVKLVRSADLKDGSGNEFELECWVD